MWPEHPRQIESIENRNVKRWQEKIAPRCWVELGWFVEEIVLVLVPQSTFFYIIVAHTHRSNNAQKCEDELRFGSDIKAALFDAIDTARNKSICGDKAKFGAFDQVPRACEKNTRFNFAFQHGAVIG